LLQGLVSNYHTCTEHCILSMTSLLTMLFDWGNIKHLKHWLTRYI